jgi:hypothetical protein
MYNYYHQNSIQFLSKGNCFLFLLGKNPVVPSGLIILSTVLLNNFQSYVAKLHFFFKYKKLSWVK